MVTAVVVAMARPSCDSAGRISVKVWLAKKWL
jgi:hypothetical protein